METFQVTKNNESWKQISTHVLQLNMKLKLTGNAINFQFIDHCELDANLNLNAHNSIKILTCLKGKDCYARTLLAITLVTYSIYFYGDMETTPQTVISIFTYNTHNFCCCKLAIFIADFIVTFIGGFNRFVAQNNFPSIFRSHLY